MKTILEVIRLREEDAELAARIALRFASNIVSAEHTAAFLAKESNILLTVLVDSEPAGFLLAHLLDRFKDTRRKLFIYEIDVLPEFQRRGIGRALIEAVLKTARERNADTAFVLTNRSNTAAVNLYAETGGIIKNPDDVMFEYKVE